MQKSFHEWVVTRLTPLEYEILINHTQPGDNGYAGLNVSQCRKKYKIGDKRFAQILDKLEDHAVTYERQVIMDG